MADNKDTKTKADKEEAPNTFTPTVVEAPEQPDPSTVSGPVRNVTVTGEPVPGGAIGDPGVNLTGASQMGVTAEAPVNAFAEKEAPALDMGVVHQLAVAMAAAQVVRTVMVPPTPGLDDTTKAAKPYVINSIGQVVDANGFPIPADKVDAETKAQAAKVRVSIPGVQFAEKEV